mmetsp:Transcript_9265/g.27784  ORF Transcript_9265/g.27784 Transcript_9265/m.27784 type:complete len:202 (+) Transcript_9265:441-1046(+)
MAKFLTLLPASTSSLAMSDAEKTSVSRSRFALPTAGMVSPSQSSAHAIWPTAGCANPRSLRFMPHALLKEREVEKLPNSKLMSICKSRLFSKYTGISPPPKNPPINEPMRSAVGVMVNTAAMLPLPPAGKVAAGISVTAPAGVRSLPMKIWLACELLITTEYGLGFWHVVTAVSFKCSPTRPWSNQNLSTFGGSSWQVMGL